MPPEKTSSEGFVLTKAPRDRPAQCAGLHLTVAAITHVTQIPTPATSPISCRSWDAHSMRGFLNSRRL